MSQEILIFSQDHSSLLKGRDLCFFIGMCLASTKVSGTQNALNKYLLTECECCLPSVNLLFQCLSDLSTEASLTEDSEGTTGISRPMAAQLCCAPQMLPFFFFFFQQFFNSFLSWNVSYISHKLYFSLRKESEQIFCSQNNFLGRTFKHADVSKPVPQCPSLPFCQAQYFLMHFSLRLFLCFSLMSSLWPPFLYISLTFQAYLAQLSDSCQFKNKLCVLWSNYNSRQRANERGVKALGIWSTEVVLQRNQPM